MSRDKHHHHHGILTILGMSKNSCWWCHHGCYSSQPVRTFTSLHFTSHHTLVSFLRNTTFLHTLSLLYFILFPCSSFLIYPFLFFFYPFTSFYFLSVFQLLFFHSFVHFTFSFLLSYTFSILPSFHPFLSHLSSSCLFSVLSFFPSSVFRPCFLSRSFFLTL